MYKQSKEKYYGELEKVKEKSNRKILRVNFIIYASALDYKIDSHSLYLFDMI